MIKTIIKISAIEINFLLERGVSGKSKFKSFADAFGITGYIKRISTEQCTTRLEASRKERIIEFLSALAFEMMEKTSFEFVFSSLKYLGRKEYTKFSIISNQQCKSDVQTVSSDKSTIVPKFSKGSKLRNSTIHQMLADLLETVVPESDISESEQSDSDKQRRLPTRLKYSIFESPSKYVVEVLVPFVMMESISVEFTASRIVVQTAAATSLHEGMKVIQDGFTYGGCTVTEITLPPNATKLEDDAKLINGVLVLTVYKEKKKTKKVNISQYTTTQAMSSFEMVE